MPVPSGRSSAPRPRWSPSPASRPRTVRWRCAAAARCSSSWSTAPSPWTPSTPAPRWPWRSVRWAATARPSTVLVGGLGLGMTARAVLADPRVRHVDVVELAAPLFGWARDGLVPELAGLEGERCTLHVADVLDVLAGAAPAHGPWDAVLLDVDNGPDFLVHAFQRAAVHGIRPRGGSFGAAAGRPARGVVVTPGSRAAAALARWRVTVTRSARTSCRSSARAARSGTPSTRSPAWAAPCEDDEP